MSEQTAPGAERSEEARFASPLDLGPSPSFVGYMLRRAQLVVFDDFIRTMAAIGLRPASFSVLTVIDANPGSTQTAVSEALGLQRTNLVAIIDALQERGLVRRAPARSDRRAHALFLTDEGRQLLKQAMALQAEHESCFLRRLGQDGGEQLARLLRKILDDGGG